MFVSGDVGCVCLVCDMYVHSVYTYVSVRLYTKDPWKLYHYLPYFLEAESPIEHGARRAARKFQ